MFSAIWVIYFFLAWVTAKKNLDGSEISKKQIMLRRVAIIALILSAIFGLLYYWFAAMMGAAWSPR